MNHNFIFYNVIFANDNDSKNAVVGFEVLNLAIVGVSWWSSLFEF